MTVLTNTVRWSDNTDALRKNLLEGIDTLDAMKKSVDRTASTLQTGLLLAANKTAAAIDQIGGATKLTAAEQDRANVILEKALDKYKALGVAAPTAIRELAEATKRGSEATGGWIPLLQAMGTSWVARIAEGVLLRDAIHGVIGGIKDAATALPALALKGAGIADVEENFRKLTAQAGLLGTTLLGTLRSGTHNTITDFELMKTVNKDLAAGLNLTDQQFGVLSKGAFALAQATGTDVKTAFDTMNDAMLTGRTRSLALLVSKNDLKKGEELYAASLKTTIDQLNDEGKLEATRAGTLFAVGEATARLGEQTDGLDERVAQIQTTWTNFQENLGKTIATSAVLESGMVGLKTALQDALGGTQETAIKAIGLAVDELLIDIMRLAKDGVEVAGFLVKEWYAAKKVFGDIAQVVDSFRIGLLDIQRAAALGLLPGSNIDLSKFKEINQQIHDMEAAMRARAAALKEDDKAQAAVDATTAKYVQTIENLRAKMDAARTTAVNFVGPLQDGAKAMNADAIAAAKAAAGRANLVKASTDAAAALKKYNEAWIDANSVQESAIDTVNALDKTLVGTIKYYLNAGRSVEQLAAMFPKLTKAQVAAISTVNELEGSIQKLSRAQIDVVADAVRQERNIQLVARAYGINVRAAEDYAASLKKIQGIEVTGLFNYSGLTSLGTKLPPINEELLKSINRLHDLAFTGKAAADGLEKIGIVLKPSMDDIKGKYFDTWATGLDAMAKQFQQLGSISGGSLGGILKDMGSIVISLNAAQKAEEAFAKAHNISVSKVSGGIAAPLFSNQASNAEKGAAALASAFTIVAGVRNVGEAVNNQETQGGRIISGAAAGAQAGAAFGPYGAAFGALAGAAYGWFTTPAWVQNMEDVGRNWGVKISRGLSEQIIASQHTFEASSQKLLQQALTDKQAGKIDASQFQAIYNARGKAVNAAPELMHIGGIIQEDGGLNAENLEKYASKLKEVFTFYKDGVLDVTQATKILDDNFGTFVAAATSGVGSLDKTMVGFIADAEQAGLRSKSIGDYLGGQATNAANSFGAALSITASAMKELAEGSNLSVDRIKELNGIIDATSLKTQGAATAIGTGLAGAFSQMINSGASFEQAIASIKPGVDALGAQLVGTGMNGGAAFTALQSAVELASDAVAGPALMSVNNLALGMVSLSNMGKLNQETFGDLSGQIDSTFNSLTAQGKDGATVMFAMQTPLQQLWELQDKFGFTTDATTQKLIDQAKEAGIVGPEMKKPMDQLLDVMREIRDTLQGVTDKTGGLKSALNELPTERTFRYTFESSGAGVPEGYASGSGGIRDFGRGTPAILHGREAVVTERELQTINQGGGSISTAALEKEIKALRAELLYQQRRQPQATAIAMADALVTAGIGRRS